MKYIILTLICFINSFNNADTQGGDNQCSRRQNINQYYSELLNHELIGLGYNDQEEDFYTQFYIEFEALCYGGTPAFFIDTTKNEIYIFDFIQGQGCLNKMPIKSSIICTYNIDSIKFDNSKCKFYATQVFHRNSKSNRYGNLLFTFSKFKHEVYSLKIYEKGRELKKDFISRYTYYINSKYQDKFLHEECGDFDG